MHATRLRRIAVALAVTSLAVGAATGSTLAQDYSGSEVSVGGGVRGVGNGDIVVVAPGVTISGGDVSNSTGIGVDSGGGSSIGTTAGGSDSAAVVE